MKIKILYSHLNVTRNDYKIRPIWFDFEKCFKNLLSTIPNIELHVIYDTSKGEITNNWINNYTSYFTLHNIQGGTMEKAAVGMYNVAKELSNDMNDDDLFYFLENDYLHINGWIEKVTDLFKSFKGLNYISLYDHNDKYTNEIYDDLVSKVFVTNTTHWRTVPSTCGSYLVSKKIFLEDYIDLTTIMGDHNKWIYLNETKNRFVLTPIPGLSTHCMEGLMSPTIEWDKIENIEKSIIVSRYEEDISWLFQINPKIKKYIYNKGDVNTNYISLPNIGRESHTFLHHIVTHYNTLSDINIFVQGDPFPHCSNVIELINNTNTYTPLSPNTYSESNNYYFNVLCNSVWELFDLSNPHPEPVEYYPGAQYIVTKDQILYYKKEFYEKLLEMHTISGNNIVFGINDVTRKGYDGITPMPWIMERYWKYIWEKSLYEDV